MADRMRIDKWLWAARFYKTRALAKEAIEGGKVHCRGERCKPGKEPKGASRPGQAPIRGRACTFASSTFPA